MKETVYIETSIFSFYYDERPGHSVIAMRDWTREWWNEHSEDYLLTTSIARRAATGDRGLLGIAIAIAIDLFRPLPIAIPIAISIANQYLMEMTA
uniref:PIN domain-containing protein n=1 Tax=Candidatus Kentrum sp. FM TaxID=2126340 RepID=A0A450TS29_9GAMM|nr:MAG: hypothetical protein BECKFM1743C_GA0114222_105882 [Candidatus Kentron sp. FM]